MKWWPQNIQRNWFILPKDTKNCCWYSSHLGGSPYSRCRESPWNIWCRPSAPPTSSTLEVEAILPEWSGVLCSVDSNHEEVYFLSQSHELCSFSLSDLMKADSIVTHSVAATNILKFTVDRKTVVTVSFVGYVQLNHSIGTRLLNRMVHSKLLYRKHCKLYFMWLEQKDNSVSLPSKRAEDSVPRAESLQTWPSFELLTGRAADVLKRSQHPRHGLYHRNEPVL